MTAFGSFGARLWTALPLGLMLLTGALLTATPTGTTRTWLGHPDATLAHERRMRVRAPLLDRRGRPILSYVLRDGVVRLDAAVEGIPLLSSGEVRQWTAFPGPASDSDESRRLSFDLDLQLEAERLVRQMPSDRAVLVVVDASGRVRAAAERAPARDSLMGPQFTTARITPGSLVKVPATIVASDAGFAAPTVLAPAWTRVSGGVVFRNAGGRDHGRVSFPVQVLERSPFTAMVEPARYLRASGRDALAGSARRGGVAVVAAASGVPRDTGFWAGGPTTWRAANAPWRLTWILPKRPTAADLVQTLNGQAFVQASGAAMMAYLHAVMRGDGLAPRYAVEASVPECPVSRRRLVAAPIVPEVREGLRAAARTGTARALAEGAVRRAWPRSVVMAKTGTPTVEVRRGGARVMEEHGTAVVGIAQRPGAPLALVAYAYLGERSSGAQAAILADSVLATAVRLGLGRVPRCVGGAS